MGHWMIIIGGDLNSVGVIGDQRGITGDQCSSVKLTGAKWRLFGLSGHQWGLIGV